MFALRHRYISITEDGKQSFGGNQGWLKDGSRTDKTLADCGCGIIAAGDLFLYLARHHGCSTPLTEPIEQAEPLGRAEYLGYIREIGQKYAHIFKHMGMTGGALAGAVNRYFAAQKIGLRARWENLLIGGTRARRLIEQMLQSDIPVVISIPGTILRSGAMHLYRTPRTELPTERDRAYRYKNFGGHFVTVTGVTHNGFGETVYTISSWGRRYYLDEGELTRALHRIQGALACGLLYVSAAAPPKQRLNIRIKL